MQLSRVDRIFWLLSINAGAVIIGYALAVATHSASVPLMKLFKQVILVFSIFYVILQPDFRKSLRALNNTGLVFFLSGLLPVLAVFTEDVLGAIGRVQTLIVPLLYVMFSMSILLYRYGQIQLIKWFCWMTTVVYAIPVLSYVVYGGGFSGRTIYAGQGTENLVFISNQFGWASSMVLISSFCLLTIAQPSTRMKILLVPLYLLSIYLIIVAGNRTSMLAMVLSFVVLLLRTKTIGLFPKIILILIPLGFVYYLQGVENSAIDFLIQRTKRQQEVTGEGRLNIMNVVLKAFDRSPWYWITGVGIFDGSALNKGEEDFNGYHNSYWDLLFGLGVPLFLLFMKFMLFDPLKVFVQRVSKIDLVFIPLALIPFFESNLTGGQFLFFPWFMYIFLLNCHKDFYYEGVANVKTIS
jgi:O-antigen ligase